MNSYVWLDNKLVLQRDVDVELLYEGFLYGQGLFETMRIYGGEVFLLDRHIRRLIDSCPIMDIIAPNRDLLKTAVLETIKSNRLNSGYMRLNVWRKNTGVGILVFFKDVLLCSQDDYEKGFSAIIFEDIRQSETSPLARVKSLNHYFYIMLGRKARDLAVDEAIILNSKGSICEGARSNIFVIKEDKIFTPPIDCGCLPGITREVTMEIAGHLEMDIEEQEIRPEDLLASQEAFLTNSLIEIMALTRIEAKPIGDGKPGNKTKLILNRYRELIKGGYI